MEHAQLGQRAFDELVRLEDTRGIDSR